MCRYFRRMCRYAASCAVIVRAGGLVSSRHVVSQRRGRGFFAFSNLTAPRGMSFDSTLISVTWSVVVPIGLLVMCRYVPIFRQLEGLEGFSTNSHIRESSPREIVEKPSKLSKPSTGHVAQFLCKACGLSLFSRIACSCACQTRCRS